MTRGQLRVYLGAAPGVGKTYRMLDEGRRRWQRGTDLVVGLVETHGHAVPGAWLIENPGFVSGGSTLWLAGLLGVGQAEVFPLALNAPPGSEGVLFLPALSGATAPRWNDRMRGGLLGLGTGVMLAGLALVLLGATRRRRRLSA